MKKIILLLTVLLLSSQLNAAQLGRVGFDLDMEKLENGKLQIFEEHFGDTKKRVVGVILIDAPPHEVWQVIVDWDSMGDYVPGLDYYRTEYVIKPIDENGGRSLIEGKLSIPLVNIQYTLNTTFDAGNMRQEWQLVTAAAAEKYQKEGVQVSGPSSGLSNIEGYGFLEPYAEGRKTVYVYAPIVEVGMKLPASIDRALSKNSLSGYVKAVKKRVESADR